MVCIPTLEHENEKNRTVFGILIEKNAKDIYVALIFPISFSSVFIRDVLISSRKV